MFDLAAVPDDVLAPVTSVVAALRERHAGLDPKSLMVVGAQCRDILHTALGHRFDTAATRDLDLALALHSWDDYSAVTAGLTQLGSSGVRYDIAGTAVDLLPFGDIENPTGVAAPAQRGEPLSVWGMTEVHGGAESLALEDGVLVALPTVPGYAALKMVAWLDRREPRDAADLALAAYWYCHDRDVEDALWGGDTGNQLIVEEDFDVTRACVRQLGADITTSVGQVRRSELLDRWTGEEDTFTHEFRVVAVPGWTGDHVRRRELVDALTRGIETGDPLGTSA